MPSKKNQESLKEFVSMLDNYDDFFIVENRGVNVSEITSFRKSLGETGSSFCIVKNRVFKIALHEKNIKDVDPFLKKSSGVLFVKDPVKDAKALGAFLKNVQDKISIKCGYTDGKVVDAEYIKVLSTLSTKEELVAKLLMILKHPVQRMAMTLSAIIKQKSENQEA